MANTIKLKRGTSTPTTSNIVDGEVAIDKTAKKLYLNDGGTIKEIGGGGGGASALNDLSDAKTDNSDAAIGIGSGALAADDSTNTTIAIGKDALNDQTSGNFNCAVGVESFSKITSSAQNTAFGIYAGRYNTGSSNVALGYKAMAGSDGNSAGHNNVVIGEKALEDGQGANNNVMIGYRASKDGTGTENSVAIGSESLFAGTTLYLTTTVGRQSFYSLTSGHRSSAFGYQSGYNATSAVDSTFYGYKSGFFVTSGTQNTCIGTEAGGNSTPNVLTTGSNNIVIGYQSFPSSATVSNEITLGNGNITKFRVPALNFVVKSSTATEGHVLTVDASGEAGFAAASGGGGSLTLISSTTFTSAVSAVTFTSISGYTQYKIIFNMQTSGAGTLEMRVGIDGTYDTGNNYIGPATDSSILILGGFSATSKQGEINIFDLNQAESTLLYALGVGFSNDETSANHQSSGGAHSTAAAQNCIQLFGSSGNISSGTVSLYGIATS